MKSTLLRRVAVPAASVAVLALALSACGSSSGSSSASSSGLSGSVNVDGSSTVAPMTQVAQELFSADNPDVKITVGTSGTGGGFEKFCAGETDMNDASRPIEDTEAAACKSKGITYQEMVVANDALTVVVNKDNTWATCLTTDQLAKIWAPKSTIDNWNQVDPSFPDQTLTLYGPDTDSGTFDYFTAAINGEEGASRTDYSPSSNDNNTVTGVAGDKGAMGYFGYTYYEQNQDKLNAVSIDAGNGCVAPSASTVQDAT
ncbi:MAG: PstS family phosphate ABC transporter substrate-binding protein, partial [Actinomycetes bacterium]